MTTAYDQVLAAAVADVAARGYLSPEQIAFWEGELRRAAEQSLRSAADVERMAAEAMAALFAKLVDRGGALRHHPGVARSTLDRIRPQLHADLAKRVRSNAELIKLNRAEAIDKTLRRFRGWATSVPEGGAPTDRAAQKAEIRRSLSQLPFEDRRCVIDQTSKLNAAINQTIAEGGGAIGARWMSHKHQAGYDGRPEHNARDGHILLLRTSWARDKGLVRPGPAGYTDEIEQPGQFVFCRCWYSYIYSLRSLPDDMLTAKGRAALHAARAAVMAT